MPLMNSKSNNAFKSNLKAEMHAGKPQKQALAIAYSVKRRAKKAYGGMMTGRPAAEDKHSGGYTEETDSELHPHIKPMELSESSEHDSDPLCVDCMAEGGMCYAHGGESSNEKLHPNVEPMHPMEIAKMIRSKRMAEGGMVDDDGSDMLPRLDHKLNTDPSLEGYALTDTYPEHDHEESDTMAQDKEDISSPGSNELGDEDEEMNRRKARMRRVLGD
jgi:hypothetical protein